MAPGWRQSCLSRTLKTLAIPRRSSGLSSISSSRRILRPGLSRLTVAANRISGGRFRLSHRRVWGSLGRGRRAKVELPCTDRQRAQTRCSFAAQTGSAVGFPREIPIGTAHGRPIHRDMARFRGMAPGPFLVKSQRDSSVTHSPWPRSLVVRADKLFQ